MSERNDTLEQAALAVEALFVEMQGRAPFELYEYGYADAISSAASVIRQQKLNVPPSWPALRRPLARNRDDLPIESPEESDRRVTTFDIEGWPRWLRIAYYVTFPISGPLLFFSAMIGTFVVGLAVMAWCLLMLLFQLARSLPRPECGEGQ